MKRKTVRINKDKVGNQKQINDFDLNLVVIVIFSLIIITLSNLTNIVFY